MATRAPLDAESLALLDALEIFKLRSFRDDFSSVERFINDFPDSAWTVSLRSILGGEYYRTGHYSKAIDSWRSAWNQGKAFTNEVSTTLASEAVGELALMYARLGRMAEIRQVLAEVDKRQFRASASRNILGARDGLWSMEHQPETSFRCGPLALDRICAATDRAKAGNQLIQDSHSTTNGFSVRQVAELSRRLGMNYQVVFRDPGAAVILPAVVHWKVGHFAALIARDGLLLRAEDPTFRNKTWLSDSTLDEEASGYFLVRAGPLPAGWRAVSDDEADRIWGKGTTNISDPDSTTPYDLTAKPLDSCQGMAAWNVHLLLASQLIQDTPVGYTPPVGPPVYFTVTYNSASAQGLEGPDYSNVSPDWRCNWLAYITDDPMNPAGDIRFAVDGGGTLTFTDYNSTNQVFQNLTRNRADLVRISTNRYELLYPDGAKKIFDLPTASAGTLRRIYMTAVVDPAGNSATIQFDSPGRITGITDALGQQTKLYYEVSDTNVLQQWQWVQGYIITRVVDPFGRTARFQPSAAVFAHLTNIVDSLGLSSSFVDTAKNNVGWWISDMTTPYGTTHFDADSYKEITRANWLEITNPDGSKERVEYNEGASGILTSDPLAIVPKGVPVRNFILFARNTFYWDRKAYAESFSQNFLGYTHAKIYHFTHGGDYNTASPILESYKAPFENRVWFNYEGQASPTFVGTSDRQTKIARVLDDGTTQLYQYEYNSLGNPTRSIDPIGRTLTFVYETNQIDLREIRQTRAGQNELLFRATYNTQHRPLSTTDAAGKTTVFTYNPRGQLLTATNPRGEQGIFSYDANGFLTMIDGPLAETNDTIRFTYDAIGRLQTATGPDGYRVGLDYDAMDRRTRLTYPDGTFESISYNRLDPEILINRAGQQNRLTYDSLRQLTAVQDALGRVTRYEWCGCGGLQAIVDAMGHATAWTRDVQGRVVAKVYPGGSQVLYDYEPATGNLRSIRDEYNQITFFRYNVDGTLRQKSYLNARVPTPTVSFTYDPDYLRVLSMEDGTGLTSYGYYPITGAPSLGAGRLATIDGPLANDTVGFSYDDLGRVSNRSINGVAVQRVYDAAGRLTQMTNVLGIFTLAWDGGSDRLSSVQYPNGQRTDYSFYGVVQDRLLQSITHRLPNNSILSQFTYAYNTIGQITNWTQLQGAALKSWAPTYDAGDRLLSLAESPGSVPVQTFDYAYDDADNRTSEQTNGVQRLFGHNALNQVTTISDSLFAATSCQWDAAHRLVTISNGTHRTEFSYDGLDRRIGIVEKESGATVSQKRYLWDGQQLCEERDATGAVILKRFSSFGLSSSAGSDLPVGNYFFTRDHLASVREMCDQSGNIRGRFEFSPYGDRQRLSGDLEPGFGFTGHPLHLPSGLYLAPARAYDPRLARWTSRDPLGESDGANLYAYVSSDPMNFLDPLGESGTKADTLVQNTTGYQAAKAAVVGYETAQAVPKALDTTVKQKVQGMGEDAIKKIVPSPSQQYTEGTTKIANTADASGHLYDKAVDQTFGQTFRALEGKPCAPGAVPAPAKVDPKGPGALESLWNSFVDIFHSNPEPPLPPRDGRITPKINNDAALRAAAAASLD